MPKKRIKVRVRRKVPKRIKVRVRRRKKHNPRPPRKPKLIA